METAETNGELPNQSAHSVGEGGDLGEDSTPSLDRYADLDARLDVIANSISEMGRSIGQMQTPAPAATVEEDFDEEDDDEPLTASRVNRIIGNQIKKAARQSDVQSLRREWDNKTRSDFPINDPVFHAQFNKEWSHFQDSGGDINSPKAIYNTCSLTARVLGTKSKAKSKSSGTEITGEASTSSAASSSSRRTTGKVADDDPRVQFFMLRNSDPKKVLAFKDKLAEKDAKAARRRR